MQIVTSRKSDIIFIYKLGFYFISHIIAFKNIELVFLLICNI